MAEMQIAVGRRREAENTHPVTPGLDPGVHLESIQAFHAGWIAGSSPAMTKSKMTHFLHTDADLQAALTQLIRADPRLKPVAGKAGAKGKIDLTQVGNMEADLAHAALTALHGVGPWTADIYLLFCLGHADAFPAGDLAVQEAARIALRLRKRPDAKRLAKIAEAWRPWRGVAAHLLWAYYHAVKKRDVVPVQPSAKKPQAKKRKRKNG